MKLDDPGTLYLASKPCSQCLTSKRRIVSDARAEELIADCRESGKHFICHKGSIAGCNLHCAGVHALKPSTSYKVAKAIGIPIELVDPDSLDD